MSRILGLKPSQCLAWETHVARYRIDVDALANPLNFTFLEES